MTGSIRLTKYRGRNGGFAQKDSTLYRVDLVGVNGLVQNIDTQISSLKDAQRICRYWSELTGFAETRMEERLVQTTQLVEWKEETNASET